VCTEILGEDAHTFDCGYGVGMGDSGGFSRVLLWVWDRYGDSGGFLRILLWVWGLKFNPHGITRLVKRWSKSSSSSDCLLLLFA